MSNNQYSAASAIGLVTKRELRVNLLKKSSIITLIIGVLLAVGGVLVASYLTRDSDEEKTYQVAVVGEAPFAAATADGINAHADAAGTEEGQSGSGGSAESAGSTTAGSAFLPGMDGGTDRIELVPAADESAALRMLVDKQADAALIPTSDPKVWTFIDLDTPNWLATAFDQGLTQQVQGEAIALAGGDPAEFFAAAAQSGLVFENFEDDQPAHYNVDPAEMITGLILVALIFMAILTFGNAVAVSVIEEKSSRVIEIILSTIRPKHLLAGKILGTGIAGLVYTFVIVAAAAITAIATGLHQTFTIPWHVVGWYFPFFILGYFFFAALYAATGSLVSRMEDFGGVQFPVMILALGSIYVPAFGWHSLDSSFMQASGWIPPVSIGTAPLQYLVGNLNTAQLLMSLGLLAVAVALVVLFAARVYPRNVLRTGSRVPWKQALSGKED